MKRSTLLAAVAAVFMPGAALAQATAAQPAPTAQPSPATPPALPTPAGPDYTQDSAWLCKPGLTGNLCAAPPPATVVTPTGYGAPVAAQAAANPPVDCFYVYPTVSSDQTLNSDLNAGQSEEIGATIVQAARFSQVCRVYAPLYRQVTSAGLFRAILGANINPQVDIAYGDVVAAFRRFQAIRGAGRPFVLIGHSQGSIMLQRLIREEIEGHAEHRSMVSAILIGWNTLVPPGRVVGGTYRETPLCTRNGQTGCVISYSTFREGHPPPEGALFGRADTAQFGVPAPAGMTVACTNPAALGSDGPALLSSFWLAAGPRGQAWSSSGTAPTPFVTTPGLVTAQCVHDGPAGYLSIHVNADPADARADDIPGDVVFAGRPQAGWGLHPSDMSLGQGNLVEIVRAQAAAFRPRR